MSESEDSPGPERGLSKLFTRRRKRPDEPDNDFLPEMRAALAATPFPMILRELTDRSSTTDATALRREADSAFDSAREARDEGRHQACLWHLCHAAAANLLAGRRDDLATSVGNLGAELAEFNRLDESSSVQRAAAILKTVNGAQPSLISRSFRLMAHNRFRQGAYADAQRIMEMAAPVATADHEMHRLATAVRDAIERRTALEEALDSGQAATEDPVVELAAKAGRARVVGDARTQYQTLHEVGVALLRMDMSLEAFQYARRAADAAIDASDPKAAVIALQLAARASVYTGDQAAARALLDEALVLEQGCDTALALELVTSSAVLWARDGFPDEAAQRIARALERAGAASPTDQVWKWYSQAGTLLWRHEQHVLARYILSSGRERAAELEAPNRWTSEAERQLAHFNAALHDRRQAVALLESSLYVAHRSGDTDMLTRNLLDLARARADNGNLGGAHQALRLAEQYLSDDEAVRRLHAETNEEVARVRASTESGGTAFTGFGRAPSSDTIARNMRIGILMGKVKRLYPPKDSSQAERLIDCCLSLGGECSTSPDLTVGARMAYLMAFRTALIEDLRQCRGAILHDYGVLLARQGQHTSARRIFRAALHEKDRYASGAHRFSTQLALARSSQASGVTPDLAFLDTDLPAGLEQSRGGRAEVLLVAASLYENANRLDAAGEVAAQALACLQPEDSVETRVRVAQLTATIAARRGSPDTAVQHWHHALEALDAGRARLRGDEPLDWRTLTVGTIEPLLETLFDAGPHRSEEGLQVLEHTKVRTILRRHGVWQVPRPEGFPPELARQEDFYLTLLRSHDFHVAPSASTDARIAFATSVNDGTRRDAHAFWEALPDPWRDYGALRRGVPPRVLPLAARSSAHVIVLFPTARRTLVWHIDPAGTIRGWHQVPVTQADAARVTEAVMLSMREHKPLPAAWHDFSAALTAPWLAMVPENDTICFVPSRALLELPFAMLRPTAAYLTARNPVACLPALSLFAYGTARSALAPERVTVLGDSLGDLPGARREAVAVARRLGTTAVLGQEANHRALSRALSQCDLLHVSGHARFDQAAPERTGFVLADGSTFSARDALDARVRAHLAVLSGCESGRLDWAANDVLTGVSTNLLAAGFRAVVATSWRIPDGPTEMLLDAFYDALLEGHHDIAGALRAAQLRLLRDRRYADPYAWAAFRVLGDWRWTAADPRPARAHD
jgi:tetratricopeptide (TPR) repeat protein